MYKIFSDQYLKWTPPCVDLIEEKLMMLDNYEYHGVGAPDCYLMLIDGIPSEYDIEMGRFFSDKIDSKVFGILRYIDEKISFSLRNNYFITKVCDKWDSTEINIARLKDEHIYANPRIIILTEEAAELLKGSIKGDLINLSRFAPYHVIPSFHKLFVKPEEYRPLMKEALDGIVKKINADSSKSLPK